MVINVFNVYHKALIKTEEKKKVRIEKRNKGIPLIALMLTILFSYDEKLKCSNNKGFLLQTI